MTYLFLFLAGFLEKGTSASDLYSKHGLLMTGIADLVLLPVFIRLFRKDERRRIAAGCAAFRIPVKKRVAAYDYCLLALFSIFFNGALEVLITLIPYHDVRGEAIMKMLSSPGAAVQIVAIGLIGPVVEEYLFRGLLYRRFRDGFGVVRAAILSAAFFGIAHGNVTQGIFAAIFGIVLALIYERYGTLKAPIAAHLANNMFAIFVQFFGNQIPAEIWLFYYSASLVVSIILMRLIFSKKRKNIAI